MSTVAVTGASGYLGRRLLGAMSDDPDVSRVIGIDVEEPDFSTGNLEFYRLDVRAPEVAEIIAGCDALVHLAETDSNDPSETFDINVGGTRSVVDAASRAGVGKLILVSTAAVYGAHPDNDYPLTEASAVRPSAESPYARARAEAEELVDYFARGHPDVVVTVLRMAWVCGPSIPTSKSRVLDAPLRLSIKGYEVPVQALHEDDAARAIVFALSRDLRGVYNVCADDWVDDPEELLGQRSTTLELDRARALLEGASRMGLSPLSAPDLPGLMYPQVMSNAKIRAEGFGFDRSTADALREGAEARRGWVGIGRLQFRPRRVALVAGTFGAVLLGSAARAAAARRRVRREKA